MAQAVGSPVFQDDISKMNEIFKQYSSPSAHKAVLRNLLCERITQLVGTIILLTIAATALAFSVQQMKLLNTPATKKIVALTAVIVAGFASSFINQAGMVGVAARARYRA